VASECWAAAAVQAVKWTDVVLSGFAAFTVGTLILGFAILMGGLI